VTLKINKKNKIYSEQNDLFSFNSLRPTLSLFITRCIHTAHWSMMQVPGWHQ